jgi:hypothetical protein
VVLVFEQAIVVEKIPNAIKDINLDTTLVFFVEKGSETIWAWGFRGS